MDSSTLDIDASGAVTLDSAAGISLDAGAASNLTTSAGALSLDGAGGLNIGTAADTAVDMDASTLDIDASSALTMTSTTMALDPSSTFDLDAAGAITLDGASFTVGGDGDTGAIAMDSTSTFQLTGVGASNVTTNGDLIISGSTSASVNSHGGDVTMESTNAAVVLTAGTMLDLNGTAFDLDTSAGIDLDSSAGAISLDSAAASNFTVDGADLTLSTSTSGDVNISGADIADFSGGTTKIGNGAGGLFFPGMESVIAGLTAGFRFASGSADVTTFLSNFDEGDQDIIGAMNKLHDLATGGNISKAVYVASGSIAADTAIEGVSMSATPWLNDDINVHLNGVLQRSGSQGTHDVYRDASGNLKFNYALEDGDFLAVQSFGS